MIFTFALSAEVIIFTQNKVPHNHNLILITAKKDNSAMLNISLYKLGDNNIFKSNQLVYTQIHYKIDCFYCEMEINGIRYICLSCNDEMDLCWTTNYSKKVNFCNRCFSIMNDNLDNNYNIYCNKSIKKKHDPKTHVYLVLYFNANFIEQSLFSY